MSKTPNYDAAVKKILDATTPGEKVCALTGERWDMTDKEIHWYKHFNVPPSEYAPIVRRQLLTSYFVGVDIWYNKHAETGKPMLSAIHPSTGIRVLDDKAWFARDFTDCGQAWDRHRPFLDQLYELSRRVPRAAQ